MKVSVVIPAHNEEEALPHTLRAILAQDYPDFEVIVVDNASTDKTAEVAKRFENRGGSAIKPSLKVVSESRKGLLWAREAGRRAAMGEIIANIDADCLPEPDWISRGVSHFTDGRIVAVSGPYDYHDAAPMFRRSSLATQRYVYKPISKLLQLPFVRGGAVLIGGNNFIRARVLEKTGGYNTALVFYGEDTDTAKRVSVHGKVLFNNRLTMKTSARRFKAEGTLKLMTVYWFHFFKHVFKRRKTAHH